MSRRFEQVQKFTGVNTDCLDGTALDPIPVTGFMRVYIGSTVNTATLSINPSVSASPNGGRDDEVILKTNGVPGTQDPHYQFQVRKGEFLRIGLGGTTGTCYLWTSLIGQ